jgi:hypothetical protein
MSLIRPSKTHSALRALFFAEREEQSCCDNALNLDGLSNNAHIVACKDQRKAWVTVVAT